MFNFTFTNICKLGGVFYFIYQKKKTNEKTRQNFVYI